VAALHGAAAVQRVTPARAGLYNRTLA